MPSKKPLLLNYILDCLHLTTYFDLLRWEDELTGTFIVNLKKMNSRGWTTEHAKHYVGWDQLNFDHGFDDRKPLGTTKYYSKSRHRFQVALERMENDQLELIAEMDENGFKKYKILDLSTISGSTSSSSSVYLDSFSSDENMMHSEGEGEGEVHLIRQEVITHDTLNETRNLTFYTDIAGQQWFSDDQENVYLATSDREKIIANFHKGVPITANANRSLKITNVQEVPVLDDLYSPSLGENVSNCFFPMDTIDNGVEKDPVVTETTNATHTTSSWPSLMDILEGCDITDFNGLKG